MQTPTREKCFSAGEEKPQLVGLKAGGDGGHWKRRYLDLRADVAIQNFNSETLA
jgi:hypothetical protein